MLLYLGTWLVGYRFGVLYFKGTFYLSSPLCWFRYLALKLWLRGSFLLLILRPKVGKGLVLTILLRKCLSDTTQTSLLCSGEKLVPGLRLLLFLFFRLCRIGVGDRLYLLKLPCCFHYLSKQLGFYHEQEDIHVFLTHSKCQIINILVWRLLLNFWVWNSQK